MKCVKMRRPARKAAAENVVEKKCAPWRRRDSAVRIAAQVPEWALLWRVALRIAGCWPGGRPQASMARS